MDDIAKLLNGFGAGDLLQILRDGRPRTRSELAHLTGFARSTIAARLDELLESGLVTPVASAASTGGRPSARVALAPGSRLVAAANLGATHAVVAIMDLTGAVLAEELANRDIAEGPASTLDWLADTFSALLRRVGRDESDLLAIGVGVPGPVEHLTGRPSSPPIMPGWDGYDVPDHLQRFFPVPVLVDNDVNVMALGEQAKAWPNVRNMIYVKASTGIGAGIISAGVLQRGENGSAGDIGHVAVARARDVLCLCGNMGCLEAVAGAPAVISQLKAEGLNVSTTVELLPLGRTANPNSLGAIRQAGRDIGEVLITCVSLTNPSLIVVGGALAKSSELLIAGIREVVYARSMPLATKNLTIAESRLGNAAGMIGAGLMALDYALAPEQVEARSSEQPLAV